MNVLYNSTTHDAATTLAETLRTLTASGTQVLLLLSGGSAIGIAVEACGSIVHPELITVTLLDERYGNVGHPDSNWQQLLDAGFPFERFTAVPVLQGKSLGETIDDFAQILTTDATVVALMGMGNDSHISGILPHSLAAFEEEAITIGYQGPDYQRVTTTPKFIGMIDHAVLQVFGHAKHTPLSDFMANDQDSSSHPVQLVKSIPNVTIVTDMKETA